MLPKSSQTHSQSFRANRCLGRSRGRTQHAELPIQRHSSAFTPSLFAQEAYIADLDAKSGASLKLTILNPVGRIWTMVAGGGASVIYA